MKHSPHKHVQPYLAPGMVIAMLSGSGNEAFLFMLDKNGNVKVTYSGSKEYDSSFLESVSADHAHWFKGLSLLNRKIATIESMHVGYVKRSQLKRWKKLAHKKLGIK